MRALSASQLLALWEQGHGAPPYHLALLLLAGACPGQSMDDLAQLSIGRRDALLLTLREWTFGPRLAAVAACPACGEQVEFNVESADIRRIPPESGDDGFQLAENGYQVDFRLPCTADLKEASVQKDPDDVRAAILRRCIRKAHRHSEEIDPEQVPEQLLEAVVAAMEKHDPQADMRFSLACPACGHGWSVLFDIVSFFWTEIRTWAPRTLQEVHQIASAYGWPEADILAMSPLRRASYLQMVGA